MTLTAPDCRRRRLLAAGSSGAARTCRPVGARRLPRRSRSPRFSGTLAGPSVALVPDPIADHHRASRAGVRGGRGELEAGRLVAAREHFDRAVDMLLAVPRRRARASRGSRPSSIGCSIASARSTCSRCARATASRRRVPSRPHRRAAERRDVRAARAGGDAPRKRSPRISRARRTTCRFAVNEQGALVRRAVPGPAARLHAGRPRPRRSATCR